MKRILTAILVAAAVATVSAAPAPGESVVQIGRGVVGTLSMPKKASPSAVLMLHGFGSSRDEVGNMYARLAKALADKGVASLRIDFQGFGKSDGDTGAMTIDSQAADAEAAYAYLVAGKAVDAKRIGVLGFSLGGGISAVVTARHPEWFKSMVTWSSVGDFMADFTAILGQEAFDTAEAKGIVGLDLGFRTIALKKGFFDSLAMFDIASLVSEFKGSYLAIAGSKDFSAAYAPGFVDSAASKVKEAWIVPDGDHIYGVLGPDQSMADSVIAKTAAWFAKNL